MHLGRGYFVFLRTASSRSNAAGDAPQRATVTVPLECGPGLDGWNMIGMPSTTAISVSRLQFAFPNGTTVGYAGAVSAGYTTPAVYGYSPTSNTYATVSQMQPFQGYWIRATQKQTGLSVLIPTGGG